MARHYRVTLDDALKAHRVALSKGGGRNGIRSEADLLSALGRPYNGYRRSISAKAAALLHGIASSHAFIDGNKRTSVLLTYALIRKSGYDIRGVDGEDLDDILDVFVERMVRERLRFEEVEAWFKERIVKP